MKVVEKRGWYLIYIYTVAGVTVSPHLTRIKEFWVRDFVTIEEMQSKGYGVKMIDYLKNLAKSEGFNRICLYTQIGNKRSQNFYDNKVSFNKYGFMYVNDI
jgi:GNAT superfamily N-acetyltransferase